MTENSNPQDEGTNLDAIEKLDIAELRRFAKLIGIAAQRDWTKADFVAALKEHQSNESTADVVLSDATAPAPGYARIVLHRDPTPGHANKPIHLSMNGQLFGVPRGIPVDIPRPFVEILANAVTNVEKQEATANTSDMGPGNMYKQEAQLSYPFQVIAITPGPYKNPYDNRAKAFALRKKFHNQHGVWPTTGELAEYRKAQAVKD